MPKHTYSAVWRRILERAGLPHCGTHAVRYRSATDIANSGLPVKVGMALTAHKTMTMFMRHVHTEDEPIRAAAEAVALRRRHVVVGLPVATVDKQTMKEFDHSCLTLASLLTPDEIRAIREKEVVSQPVFARYLNVSKNLVSDWERGTKRPGGPAVRLVTVVRKGGLQAIS